MLPQTAATNWDLVDDEASGLSFNCPGHEGLLVLDTTDGLEQIRVGETADSADFPNTQMIVSRGDTGATATTNIAIVGESISSTGAGIGIRGVGQSNDTSTGYGMFGECEVSDPADGRAAYGLIGRSISTHPGGSNIGLAGQASGGASNTALLLFAGDINTLSATDWTLKDNVASGLSFNTTDHRGLLVLDTTNDAEQVRIGDTADSADFPNARMIVSQADTGIIDVNSTIGLIGEANATGGDGSIGLQGVAKANAAGWAYGLYGYAGVTNTADTGDAIGVAAISAETHAGGDNIAFQVYADNGANNWALQFLAGDVDSRIDNQWLIGANADPTDFPLARMIVSQADSTLTNPNHTALTAEAVAEDGVALGIGIVGRAGTDGAFSAIGVTGQAKAITSADAGTAYGMQANSLSPHTGGENIALRTNAFQSSVANIAIEINNGDIRTLNTTNWDLADNTASGLSFNTTDHLGLLVLDTTNDAEMVRVGDTATSTDFPLARTIISQADIGDTFTFGPIGLVVESLAMDTIAIGVYSNASLDTDSNFSVGGWFTGSAQNAEDTGSATGVTATAQTDHAGKNTGLSAGASGGTENYAIEIAIGDVRSDFSVDWDLADDVASGLSFNSTDHRGLLVLDTTDDLEQIRIGDTADSADFPNARMIVSQADTGETHPDNIGLAIEAVASASSARDGTAIIGIAETDGARAASGIIGESGVSATGDTGAAQGLVGLSIQTHAGGDNRALVTWAANGASNYAIYSYGGDIYTASAAMDWDLADNTASGLSFNSTDHRGLLVLDTTDDAEQVRIGDTAASADFPNARMIVSQANLGVTATAAYGIGVETLTGAAVMGISRTSGSDSCIGGYFAATASAPTDTSNATAVASYATNATDGRNICYQAQAENSTVENIAIHLFRGDVKSSLQDLDWFLKDNEEAALEFKAGLDGPVLFALDTTDDAEMVRIGETASGVDYPNARMIVSQGDSGFADLGFQSQGIVGEANEAVDLRSGIGVLGVGSTRSGATIDYGAYGVYGAGRVENSADASSSFGLLGSAQAVHAGGDNIGLGVTATGGANNYAIKIFAGDVHAKTDNQWLIGANAASADFPLARAIISQADAGTPPPTQAYNIGIAAEAVASDGVASGIAIAGWAKTDGANGAYAIRGDAAPTATGDTGTAIGVAGISSHAHIGGENIGLVGQAAGSSINNYALKLPTGDIKSGNTNAIDWDLADNQAAALSFDTTDHLGLLVLDTTNDAEQVRVGATASGLDYPYARAIFSQDDAHLATIMDGWNAGLVGEAKASDSNTRLGAGLLGVCETDVGRNGYGVVGYGMAEDPSAGVAAGGYFAAAAARTTGTNVGVVAWAASAPTNYAIRIVGGDIDSTLAGGIDWDLKDNEAEALSFDSTDNPGLLKLSTVNGAESVTVSGIFNVGRNYFGIFPIINLGDYSYLTTSVQSCTLGIYDTDFAAGFVLRGTSSTEISMLAADGIGLAEVTAGSLTISGLEVDQITTKELAYEVSGIDAGYGALYAKTDGALYYKAHDGVETNLTGGGGGDFESDGSVAMTDAIELENGTLIDDSADGFFRIMNAAGQGIRFDVDTTNGICWMTQEDGTALTMAMTNAFVGTFLIEGGGMNSSGGTDNIPISVANEGGTNQGGWMTLHTGNQTNVGDFDSGALTLYTGTTNILGDSGQINIYTGAAGGTAGSLILGTDGTDALTIDASQNITVSGVISFAGGTAIGPYTVGDPVGTDGNLLIVDSAGTNGCIFDNSTYNGVTYFRAEDGNARVFDVALLNAATLYISDGRIGTQGIGGIKVQGEDVEYDNTTGTMDFGSAANTHAGNYDTGPTNVYTGASTGGASGDLNLSTGVGTPGDINFATSGVSSVHMQITGDGAIMLPTIPTSDPAVAGQLWSNGGVLTVSSG